MSKQWQAVQLQEDQNCRSAQPFAAARDCGSQKCNFLLNLLSAGRVCCSSGGFWVLGFPDSGCL